MFLSAKSMIIIIVMYSLSIMLLVGQWALGDVFGFNLSDFSGHELKDEVLTLVNTQPNSPINQFQANATSNTWENTLVNTLTASAGYLWQLVQIATGTTIFNILFLLGVPAIMVIGMTLMYIIFLMIFVISALYRFVL